MANRDIIVSKKRSIPMCLVTFGVLALLQAVMVAAESPGIPDDSAAGVVTNDVFVKDTSGNRVCAQGGGIFKSNGVYYWYAVKYSGTKAYGNNLSAGKTRNTRFAGFSFMKCPDNQD